MKKRGYFFTLDVIIAMVIMVVGFILIWSSFISETSQRQPFLYAQDMVDYFSTTTNFEMSSDPYVQELFFNKNITDLDTSVLDQMTLFFHLAKENPGEWRDEMLFGYTQAVSQDVIPRQYSYEITIDQNLIYNQTGLGNRTINSSDILMTSKKIVVIERNDIELFAPTVVEVKVWR